MPLPISLLLPTRDSMRFLPDHIECVKPLLPLVEEVIHVDSRSKDGTVEYVQQNLKHPNYRYFDHPPGLYQSWNFGIQQARSKFLYVSTVGDTMLPQGLQRLHESAERLDADAMVSIPEFKFCDGKPEPIRWPVHVMIEELRLKHPMVIPPAVNYTYAMRLIPQAILNSSASNLYRTEFMQARPFPTDFGTAGDTAWSVAHALEMKFAIIPETFSTFVFHEKTYSLKEYEVLNMAARMTRVGAEAGKRANYARPHMWQDKLEPYLDTLRALQESTNELHLWRQRYSAGWLFIPSAWKTRALRNQHRKMAAEQFQQLLVQLSTETPNMGSAVIGSAAEPRLLMSARA